MRTRSISAIRTLGWPAWSASLLLFAALCAIVSFWATVLLAPRPAIAPAGVVADPRALPELQLSAQLFGLGQPAVAAAKLSNVQVVGIVAAGRRGSAILGVDGKPPRAFAVGESLTPSQTLSAVEPDRVVIASNGRNVELPAPSAATLDVLTSGGDQPARPGAPPGAPSQGGPLIQGQPAPGLPPGASLPAPAPIPPPRAIPTVPAPAPVSPNIPVAPDQDGSPAAAPAQVQEKASD